MAYRRKKIYSRRGKVKVIFKKGQKTWTRWFKSKASAKRAISGLQSMTRWRALKSSMKRIYR